MITDLLDADLMSKPDIVLIVQVAILNARFSYFSNIQILLLQIVNTNVKHKMDYELYRFLLTSIDDYSEISYFRRWTKS